MISLIFAVSLLFLLISMYNLARISFVKWTSAADIEAGLPPYNLIYLRAERTIILRYSIVLSSISFIDTLVIGALIYILSFPAGAVQPCP